MRFPFVKMSGAGNDFIMVEHDRFAGLEEREIGNVVAELCVRRLSIGADGLVTLKATGENRVRMIYFNADGSRAGMCGNAGRCASRYAFREGWTAKALALEADDGLHRAEIVGDDVRLGMRDPRILNPRLEREYGGRPLRGVWMDTGVPHVVFWVDDVEAADVIGAGRGFRFDEEFQPEGTNVNFVEACEASVLRLRTYERGVEAETLACGTGAVAAAVAAHLQKGFSSPVRVRTRGGDLEVRFRSSEGRVTDAFLKGDARVVYEGEVEIPIERP